MARAPALGARGTHTERESAITTACDRRAPGCHPRLGVVARLAAPRALDSGAPAASRRVLLARTRSAVRDQAGAPATRPPANPRACAAEPGGTRSHAPSKRRDPSDRFRPCCRRLRLRHRRDRCERVERVSRRGRAASSRRPVTARSLARSLARAAFQERSLRAPHSSAQRTHPLWLLLGRSCIHLCAPGLRARFPGGTAARARASASSCMAAVVTELCVASGARQPGAEPHARVAAPGGRARATCASRARVSAANARAGTSSSGRPLARAARVPEQRAYLPVSTCTVCGKAAGGRAPPPVGAAAAVARAGTGAGPLGGVMPPGGGGGGRGLSHCVTPLAALK